MKTLILLLALVIASPAISQEVAKVDDSGRPYLTIITHSDWAKRPSEKKLIEDLNTEPMLNVALSCHFNHYTTADAMYQTRWSTLYPEESLPVIVLQDSNGGYWYKASGANVPSGPVEIYETIKYYRSLEPQKQLDAYSIVQQVIEEASNIVPPTPTTPDESEGRIRRPWRQDTEVPDSMELFNGKTPIRDTMSSAAMIFVGIIAITLILAMCIVGCIVLYVTLKFWR